MTVLHKNFIGGQSLSVETGDRIKVYNPARDTVLAEIPDTPADMVDRAVQAAKKAQKSWAKLPAIQRANALRRISAKIRENADKIAHVISEEQGKILPLAKVEAAFTADYLDYMAEWARRIEGEILESDRPSETILFFRQPIGVIAGVLPWNFPFFLIARKLGPALVCGNSIVIKPSEETPNNAALFVDLLAGLDIPDGVINFVHGSGRTTGDARAAIRCRPHQLHWKRCHGFGDHEGRGEEHHEGQPRTRREGSRHCVEGRRHCAGGQVRRGVPHAQHRAGLQRSRARLCRTTAGRHYEGNALRRSAWREGNRHGASNQQGRAPEDRGSRRRRDFRPR
jgi:hypothetical protein